MPHCRAQRLRITTLKFVVSAPSLSFMHACLNVAPQMWTVLVGYTPAGGATNVRAYVVSMKW